jgi:hypothetical protein
MEGLNGHFCHGFYPQVRPKSLKKSRNMAEYVAASEILMECIQEA